MANLLNSINEIVTNILVLIGLFVIVNSAIQGIKMARSEESRKYAWQDKLFSTIRLVGKNILIALPLFILKFLHDTVREESFATYFILSSYIIIAYLFLSYRYLKSKPNNKV